jgi:DNA-directed RNA polymerase specialized sigma24 family protein
VDRRLAQVVECRFFGGLTESDTAEALGVTVRTVQRDWVKARVLLRRMLES